MGKMRVWTKQHINILETLKDYGRHISKKEYIVAKMEDIAPFYLDVYHWYTGEASKIVPKPPDVKYPVWVSLCEESTLGNDADTVVLELEIDCDQVLEVDYDKWGYS